MRALPTPDFFVVCHDMNPRPYNKAQPARLLPYRRLYKRLKDDMDRLNDVMELVLKRVVEMHEEIQKLKDEVERRCNGPTG